MTVTIEGDEEAVLGDGFNGCWQLSFRLSTLVGVSLSSSRMSCDEKSKSWVERKGKMSSSIAFTSCIRGREGATCTWDVCRANILGPGVKEDLGTTAEACPCLLDGNLETGGRDVGVDRISSSSSRSS